MNKYVAPFTTCRPVQRTNNKDYSYAVAVLYSIAYLGEDGTPDDVDLIEQNAFSKTILGAKKAIARRIGVDRHDLVAGNDLPFEWNAKLRHIKKIISVEVVELTKEAL